MSFLKYPIPNCKSSPPITPSSLEGLRKYMALHCDLKIHQFWLMFYSYPNRRGKGCSSISNCSVGLCSAPNFQLLNIYFILYIFGIKRSLKAIRLRNGYTCSIKSGVYKSKAGRCIWLLCYIELLK